MKTTDLAIIFVAIMLPIVIVVYVDISFLQKAEEQRLYYTNIINSAIDDATHVMKTVESEEQDTDYGYSGISEKKVSANARIAVETFYNSLYNNFEIKGDKTGEDYIKSHIPALAIIDYNGVYVYSIDKFTNIDKNGKNEEYTDYVLKPKRYFTYTYAIENYGLIPGEDLGDTIDDLDTITVQFTMDDYIVVINPDGTQTGFYLEDSKNNSVLYGGNKDIKEEVIQHLLIKRSQVISEIVSQEMSFAVNNHNYYSDIKYNFVFPTIALSDWEQMVNNVGIIAFIQGIDVGNAKLDYVAHGISGLKITDRYYVSASNNNQLRYYHSTKECPIYIQGGKPSEGYYMSEKDAAAAGYYSCPVCKP